MSQDPIAETASALELSIPATLSTRARERIRQPYYRNYLRKVLGRVEVGDWHEDFTDVGCCGSQLHVRFRVESVHGGPTVGDETEISFVQRAEEEDGAGVDPWSVQNEIP